MTLRPALRLIGAAVLTLAPALLSAQKQERTVVTLGDQQYVRTAQSLVSVAGDINDVRYSTPVSPAYNGIASIDISAPDPRTGRPSRFICTGSLLADGKTVLTAGHCVGGDLVPTSIKVNFYPNGPTPVTITAASWTANSLYTGAVIDENDVGVIRLSNVAPPDVSRYALATTSGVNNPFKFSGFGATGSFGRGVSAGPGFGLANRKAGENFFDIQLGDPRWEGFWTSTYAHSANVLFADFDNGTTGYRSNDGMCWFGQFFRFIQQSKCDAGRGLDEASVSFGDSGGPGFVDGKIASITSFGITFGQLGPGPYPDIDTYLNSSFGEFAGFTDVAYRSEWITNHMDPTSIGPTVDGPTVVPEPATNVLLASGLIAIAGFLGRRRRA